MAVSIDSHKHSPCYVTLAFPQTCRRNSIRPHYRSFPLSFLTVHERQISLSQGTRRFRSFLRQDFDETREKDIPAFASPFTRREKRTYSRLPFFFFKKYRFGDLTHAKRCPYRNELITSTCNLRVVSWCDTFDFIPLMFPLSEISVWSRIVFIIREKYSSHTKSNKAASNNACLKHFYFLRLSFQTILRFTVMS